MVVRCACCIEKKIANLEFWDFLSHGLSVWQCWLIRLALRRLESVLLDKFALARSKPYLALYNARRYEMDVLVEG